MTRNALFQTNVEIMQGTREANPLTDRFAHKYPLPVALAGLKLRPSKRNWTPPMAPEIGSES